MRILSIRHIIASAVFAVLAFAAAVTPAFGQSAQLKPALDQLNALRAEPERAGELLEGFINDAFANENERNQMFADKYNGKTSRQLLDEAIAYIQSQPKADPLLWDADLATIAGTAGGTSSNKLFKLNSLTTCDDDNAKKAILWLFVRGYAGDYKPLLGNGARYVGMGLRNGKIVVASGSAKGKAYILKASDFGGRPYDPREDAVAPWEDTLSVKQPNITSFVKADGSLDVVWRDMGVPPRVYLTRFSANGSRVFTKEVPGVDASRYPLLAGFIEDPDGNIYVLRAVDEGDHDKKDQPGPPNGANGKPDPNWDRPDLMRLTKLDKDGKELWTKNLGRSGPGAFGFVAPMSPNRAAEEPGRIAGLDTHSSTSRIGFFVQDGTPIIFALYGAATEWDPEITGRHQNAYWRTVDARTGEPVKGLSGQGMAHSFDSQLLVSDEGVITVERSDSGLLMANYLKTRRFPLIFQFFYGTTTDGNECFTQLGSIQPASDGYIVLFAGNNTESLNGKNVGGKESEAEMLRHRNLLVMRVKKGFAQELDALEDGSAADKKTLGVALNSMVRSEFREGLNLSGRTYLTTYSKDDSFSASRPKMVRLADGNYVVIWERWTHSPNRQGNGVNGQFDSTWAMKINQDGEILKEAVKLSDTVRITRGDEPVLWNGKATFLAGDAAEGKMMVYTVDGDLKFNAAAMAVN